MKKSALLVLRLLGFNRAQPKTRFGKYVRRFKRVLNALASRRAGFGVVRNYQGDQGRRSAMNRHGLAAGLVRLSGA